MVADVNLPTPDSVRDTEGHIQWDLVDVLVARCKERGDLTVLSVQINLSRASLWLRRKQLGLTSLPIGRPPTVQLTERQEYVMKELDAGVPKHVIAKTLGVTPQAVADSAARATAKRATAVSKGCGTCGGSGVVGCNNCPGQGSHGHVCLDCGGASTYWASNGMDKK